MKKPALLFTLMVMIACQTNAPGSGTGAANDVQGTSNGSVDDESLSKEPVKTVVDFLRWYKKDHGALDQLHLVQHAGAEYDSTKFYAVNFVETEKYLDTLRASGYISEKYLNKWRAYFKEQDDFMTKNPQNDGPPYGFEYDLVLMTQEVDQAMDGIDHIKVTDVNETSDSAAVKVDIMTKLGFTLSKHNGKWMIDTIENVEGE